MLLPRRQFSQLATLAVSSSVLAACGGAAKPSPKREPEGSAYKLSQDSRIGVYTSIPWGFRTASYWIEGPDGLIFIDTQFLLSAGKESLDKAEAITGKKTQLAIVLHPNPDKFNGTALFQARGIRVVTSAQILAAIPAVHAQRKRAFFDRYNPDYPADEPKPESFGDATQEISAAGIKVKAHVLGIGCSAAHVVVEYEGNVFVGDLVGNGTHAWVEIGEIEQWQVRLNEIVALKPKYVHPGRGTSGGMEIVQWQQGYFRRLLEEVAKENLAMPLPAGAVERVKERMMQAYPGLGYDVFLDVGLEEVLKKQAEKAKKPAVVQ